MTRIEERLLMIVGDGCSLSFSGGKDSIGITVWLSLSQHPTVEHMTFRTAAEAINWAYLKHRESEFGHLARGLELNNIDQKNRKEDLV